MIQHSETIKNQVQAFSDAYNHQDAIKLAALFSTDAEYVNIFGMRMSGRDQIESGHVAIFNSVLKGSQASYKVLEIKFPRPDVAVTLVRWQREALAGAGPGTLPPADGVIMMVLANNGGQWTFVAAQNTQASMPPKTT